MEELFKQTTREFKQSLASRFPHYAQLRDDSGNNLFHYCLQNRPGLFQHIKPMVHCYEKEFQKLMTQTNHQEETPLFTAIRNKKKLLQNLLTARWFQPEWLDQQKKGVGIMGFALKHHLENYRHLAQEFPERLGEVDGNENNLLHRCIKYRVEYLPQLQKNLWHQNQQALWTQVNRQGFTYLFMLVEYPKILRTQLESYPQALKKAQELPVSLSQAIFISSMSKAEKEEILQDLETKFDETFYRSVLQNHLVYHPLLFSSVVQDHPMLIDLLKPLWVEHLDDLDLMTPLFSLIQRYCKVGEYRRTTFLSANANYGMLCSDLLKLCEGKKDLTQAQFEAFLTLVLKPDFQNNYGHLIYFWRTLLKYNRGLKWFLESPQVEITHLVIFYPKQSYLKNESVVNDFRPYTFLHEAQRQSPQKLEQVLDSSLFTSELWEAFQKCDTGLVLKDTRLQHEVKNRAVKFRSEYQTLETLFIRGIDV